MKDIVKLINAANIRAIFALNSW